jgi:AraC-like DNA-binding protein
MGLATFLERTVTTSARDHNVKHLLELLKKHIPFAQGLVLSTLPRGELQIVQPSQVSEALIKAYSNGFHAEDIATWQAILRQKAVRGEDCWDRKKFEDTPYYQVFMQPHGLKYLVAAPVAAPVLRGYPGAVHLLRTEQQGDFTDAELRKLTDLVSKFREGPTGRKPSRSLPCASLPPGFERPPLYLMIVNEKLQSQLPGGWASLDDELRHRMVDQARKQMHSLNGHMRVTAERLQLPDSHGDHWVFREVTYRKYPAIGSGSYSFFCLQPDCCEWSVVKPSDFQADPELSRLIPALRFMEVEFSRGPGLTEIARTVDLSPFHFHRRFTELLGLTPKQFMLNCQIYQAKAELIAGEKELVDIAKDCGFAHQSHFTSRFKQATGLTPTRWRRMARVRVQEA